MKNHLTAMEIANKVYESYKTGVSEICFYIGSDEGMEEMNAAGGEKTAKLQELKRRYKNFFGVEL